MDIKRKINVFLYNIRYHNFAFATTALFSKKNYDYYKKLSEESYKAELEEYYFKRTNEVLDLENPKSFNQKIQWLKLYDSTELKTRLADKYLMKDWINEKIGEEKNVKLLGVWKEFDQIDFDSLPQKFVLKCNHGSGMNYIVKNKSELNLDEMKNIFNEWMSQNYAFVNGFELQYKNIEPYIIAEEFIEGELIDFQVWCANGKILFMVYIEQPHGKNLKISFDENWNKLDFVTSEPRLNKKIKKPEKLEQIKELSLKLAEGFKFVRVDWYITENGDFKISELTFTPAAGFCQWSPKEADTYFEEFKI